MNMDFLRHLQGMTGDKWICTSIAAVLVLFLLVRLIAWLFRGKKLRGGFHEDPAHLRARMAHDQKLQESRRYNDGGF